VKRPKRRKPKQCWSKKRIAKKEPKKNWLGKREIWREGAGKRVAKEKESKTPSRGLGYRKK